MWPKIYLLFIALPLFAEENPSPFPPPPLEPPRRLEELPRPLEPLRQIEREKNPAKADWGDKEVNEYLRGKDACAFYGHSSSREQGIVKEGPRIAFIDGAKTFPAKCEAMKKRIDSGAMRPCTSVEIAGHAGYLSVGASGIIGLNHQTVNGKVLEDFDPADPKLLVKIRDCIQKILPKGPVIFTSCGGVRRDRNNRVGIPFTPFSVTWTDRQVPVQYPGIRTATPAFANYLDRKVARALGPCCADNGGAACKAGYTVAVPGDKKIGDPLVRAKARWKARIDAIRAQYVEPISEAEAERIMLSDENPQFSPPGGGGYGRGVVGHSSSGAVPVTHESPRKLPRGTEF